jgi:signal peptidase I
MVNLLAACRILLLPLLMACGAAVLVRSTLLQTFSIPSASMAPTLEPGDHIVVTPYGGFFRSSPQRGDVVVFRGGGGYFVKRIIGLPGDVVELRDGSIVVNGHPAPEPYAVPCSQDRPGYAVLDDREYFVLGDNRPNSIDSRTWGPLRREQIVGRARLIFWSADRGGSDPAANAETLRTGSGTFATGGATRILSPVR